MTSGWEPNSMPDQQDPLHPPQETWDPNVTATQVPSLPPTVPDPHYFDPNANSVGYDPQMAYPTPPLVTRGPNGSIPPAPGPAAAPSVAPEQWAYADPNTNGAPYATPTAPPQAAWAPGGPVPQVPLPPAVSTAAPEQWAYADPNTNGAPYAQAAPPQPTWAPNGPVPHAPLPPGVSATGPGQWAYAEPGVDPTPLPGQSPYPGTPQTTWDSNGTPTQPTWDPPGPSPQVVDPPAPGPPDQWVYVDPSSYSNPYTEQPVYTSGPQVMPTVTPVEATPPPIPGPHYAPEGPPRYASGPAATNGTGYTDMSASPGYGATATPPAPLGYGPGGINGPEAPSAYGAAPTGAYEAVGPGFYGAAPPPGGSPVAGQPTDPLLSPTYQPEEGELKIKERRSWKTWQLLAAVLLAIGAGMWINGNAGTASGDPAASGSSSGGYKLPADGASATTVPPTAAAAGAGSTATTAPAGTSSTTATTAAGASTTQTTAAAVGPATVLIPQTTQSGNWTSPVFTIAGGTWNIGWAFQCTPAPTGGPTFQIFVVNSGAAPGSTPAVTSTAASGQSISPETTAGGQQVIVQTTAACRWAVKVTGSSS